MGHCDVRMSTVLSQLNIFWHNEDCGAIQHWICILEYCEDTMKHCDNKADHSYVNMGQWHPNAAKY